MKIKRDSWRIIETMLLRYPQRKKEYEEYIQDILSSTGSSDILYDPTRQEAKPQSVTEAKALKMNSAYADNAKKEIQAIEFAYGSLRPEEQTVIKIRYWTQGIKKPIPYLHIQSNYSERQMKRIVLKTIWQIGRYIGEINAA